MWSALVYAILVGTTTIVAEEGKVPITTLKDLPATNASTRIINGLPAAANQFPWQARLYFEQNNNAYLCGGALIKDQYILTAAHCVKDVKKSTYRIYLGSVSGANSEQGMREFSAIKTIVHKKYKQKKGPDNDIALIKLNQKVVQTARIRNIELANENDYLTSSEAVTVSGFGKTSDSSINYNKRLNYVSLTTITNTECERVYGSQITSNILCCRGTNSKNVCSGDSGGPVIIRRGQDYVHVGIVSFVSAQGCALAYPSGFMRTASYRKWIDKNDGLILMQSPFFILLTLVFVGALKQIMY